MKKFILIMAVILLSVYTLYACDAPEYSVSKVDDAVIESEAVSETETVEVKFTGEYPTDEFLADPDYYHFYDDPDGDWQKVLFRTDYTVTFVRFFSLETTDSWADDGSLKVSEVLYTLDELTANKPLVAETLFGDTVALRGISFVDPNGNTNYYTLSDSGMDGSLIFGKADNIIDTVSLTAESASDELLADEDAYIFYDDPSGDWSPVAFTTDTRVTNVRFFSLTATDTWSDDGELKIDEVLYTIEEFTPRMVFVAEVLFSDVYPIRGISFEDGNGNTHYYSLHDSAVDEGIGLDKADISE